MADPFSITSVVALGLQSMGNLLALIEDFRDAPRAIRQVSEESRSMLNTLSGLDQFLHKNGESQIFEEDRESLQAALNLTREIRPLLVKADDFRIARLVARMRWSLSQRTLKHLCEALKSARGTLDTSLSSFNV